MNRNYPSSIAELDLNAIQIALEIVAAVKRFAASKPYRGSITQRIEKFSTAVNDICQAAGVEPPHLIFEIDERQSSGSSSCIPSTRTIILRGRLSVITALHEVAHLLYGSSEYTACAWSLRLFRDCFSKSWERLGFTGHMAVRSVSKDEDQSLAR
jgi:hypothetical protein